MKKLISFVLVPALLCISGCMSSYVQPINGPMSQVRFHLLTPEVFAFVTTFEKPDCVGNKNIGLIGGPQHINVEQDYERVKPQMYGSRKIPGSQTIEVNIPAERLFTVLFTQVGPHSSSIVRTCKIAIEFFPKAGEQYEINYQYANGQCSVDAQRLLLNSSGEVQRVPFSESLKRVNNCSL